MYITYMPISNTFAIRLNEFDGYRLLLDEAFQRFPRIIGVCHTGKDRNNPHFHFIVDTDTAQQAIRKHLLKFFNKAKGNKHLSIKQTDGNSKAWSYLFHEHDRETFEVIINKGYSAEDIEGFISANDKVQQKIKENNSNVHMNAIFQALLDQGYTPQSPPPIPVIMKQIGRYYRTQPWMPLKQQYHKYIMKQQSMFAATDDDWDRVWMAQSALWFKYDYADLVYE